MEAIVAILVVVAAVAIFDAVALRFGADSRESVGDDHRRTAVQAVM